MSANKRMISSFKTPFFLSSLCHFIYVRAWSPVSRCFEKGNMSEKNGTSVN